jgi:hypothetical protein
MKEVSMPASDDSMADAEAVPPMFRLERLLAEPKLAPWKKPKCP